MICQMDYEEGDNLITLPCFHRLHKDCAAAWLKTQNFCPECRTKIEL